MTSTWLFVLSFLPVSFNSNIFNLSTPRLVHLPERPHHAYILCLLFGICCAAHAGGIFGILTPACPAAALTKALHPPLLLFLGGGGGGGRGEARG